MVKADAAGHKQWALNFPDGARAYTVVQTNDGGYLSAGQLLLGSATERTSWVAKTNPIPTQSFVPTPAVSPSPSVPEFSWLMILPLFISILSTAIIVKVRKSWK